MQRSTHAERLAPPDSHAAAKAKTVYLTRIDQVAELAGEERAALRPVTDRFAFRSNDYYQSLIDWADPHDPIRRIIMPERAELIDWGTLDASNEASYAVVHGLEHKYPQTALLLVTDVCGGYCRFCFRKRLFMPDNDEIARDISAGVAYIRAHPEINNVLLTGGDPLMLSTRRLTEILEQLVSIDHLHTVRVGSKMPAFNPARILDDPELPALLQRVGEKKSVYVMAHFNHPRELTVVAGRALRLLQRAGVTTTNQTPLIRGINDDVAVLRSLFTELSRLGTPPYYVFQCRPTLGNLPYSVPIEEAFDIFARAQAGCSGLAKRARFVMSHVTGKLEVVGRSDEHIYLRYHEAADPRNLGRILVLRSNPAAGWLDDYAEIGTRPPVEDAGLAEAAASAVAAAAVVTATGVAPALEAPALVHKAGGGR